MLILTLGSSVSVGAAAPTNVFTANGCPVGNYQCLGYGDPRFFYGVAPYVGTQYVAAPYVGVPYIAANYAVPGVVSYIDPRYCGDGRVSIVPDKDGNLINVCTTTSVRIYPVFADGYPYGVPYAIYR